MVLLGVVNATQKRVSTICNLPLWMMPMMLDATSGNRLMWKHVGFSPANTIFMDRETKLFRPPDIFGDFRFCPFRNDVFSCVVFDPPYYTARGDWMFDNPDQKKVRYSGSPWAHYGLYKTKRELLSNINKGVKEFHRVSKRLCFQWGEGDLSLWKILPFFKPLWKEIHRRDWQHKGFNWKMKGYKKRRKTFWVTFVRGSCQKAINGE